MKKAVVCFLLICFSFSLKGVAQESLEVVLPYRLMGGKMIVEMKMNGQIRSFIFDTGGQTALLKDVCDELHLPDFEPIKVTDVNGNVSVYNRVLVDVMGDVEGKINLRKVPAIIIPDASAFACFQVDGLIGSDLLKFFVVEIDGKNKIIKLLTNTKKVMPSLRKMLPFVQGGYMPIIQVQGGAGNSILTLFDTGCPNFFNLKESDFVSLRGMNAFSIVNEGYGEGSIGLGGLAKQDTVYRVMFPEIALCGSKFKHVFSETSTPPYTLLGVKLLDYGKVTIDYPKRCFYFEAYEDGELELEEKHYDMGLRVKDGDIIVSSLWKTSEEGLSIGDKVIAINGTPVRKYDFCESIIQGIPELKKKKVNKLTILTREGEKTVIYKKK